MGTGTGVDASLIIIFSVVVGAAFAAYQFMQVAKIKLDVPFQSPSGSRENLETALKSDENAMAKVVEIYEAIREGANSFLYAEYTICAYFIFVFAFVIVWVVAAGQSYAWTRGWLTGFSFVVGGVTSIASGYIGMVTAVYANARTTVEAQKDGFQKCFNVAFRAGGVMGFALVSLAIAMLYMVIGICMGKYTFDDCNADPSLPTVGCPSAANNTPQVGQYDAAELFQVVTGFGLGGSSIALFGRVGGGIYTKAADVGADLVGKVVHGIPEDDPRNPAVVADNVGDNVGDVAGMGADLFGSFAESMCAVLVVAGENNSLVNAGWGAVIFPLTIPAVGVFVCMLCSFLATHIDPVKKESDVERVLKYQLVSTTLCMTPVVYGLARWFLPNDFYIERALLVLHCTPAKAWICVMSGTWAGLLIGFATEYYTSHSYTPVREVANACKTGAATNIIYGMALGYKSTIVPALTMAACVYTSFRLCDIYGVGLAAVGMLCTLPTGLTIDAYGPVCDNAGGIAEMAGLESYVRDKTDALDAAGNTTAAIGKGFAIGSAALVSLALFGAFTTRLDLLYGIDILKPPTFAGLLIGTMLPYWFSAMTMKSVGEAAMEMVLEVERQFNETPGLLEGKEGVKPDYKRCIEISTRASLKAMIAPGALVMITPIVIGLFFGVYAVSGLLAGGMSSGVQMAVASSNTGGAWDNAKKYIESMGPEDELKGKGSDIHKAAVVGDTVGDPLKDTSGPSLNILMKLMAILSLVFADAFLAVKDGNGVFDIYGGPFPGPGK